MNTTTAITLNDRFSMIKKQPSQTTLGGGGGVVGAANVGVVRGRSRSRSRSRGPPKRQSADQLRGSRRNQMLLNQLERQHKLRVAMKLKNVCCCSNKAK